ncbi:MAG: helix-turn-helix domain-containing protein [Treponema sp.]|nr:helix-turn-helix domain-containing protein [Treponema sp.]
MESYGAILKKAREEKNLELETISRDIAITSYYLEALEKEETSAFPGEPYIVGFLRNYANYLGVDVERVLSLYHAKVVQEAPIPEGLIVREKSKYFLPIIIGISVFIVLLGVFLGIFFAKKSSIAKQNSLEISKNSDSKKYEMSEKPLKARFYKNDQIVLNTINGEIILTVANTVGSLGLETPVGIQYVELSEEIELDVDGNSVPELIIYVSDVSNEAVDRGAEAKILLKSGLNILVNETKENEIPNVQDLPQDQNRTVILEDTRAYPFTITATFRAGCVSRYKIDRKELIEDYFTNGDIVNMTASNGVRLWFSNGNALKLQVIANSQTYNLAIPKAGQVVVEDIRWIRDTDGKYKLVVNELD